MRAKLEAHLPSRAEVLASAFFYGHEPAASTTQVLISTAMRPQSASSQHCNLKLQLTQISCASACSGSSHPVSSIEPNAIGQLARAGECYGHAIAASLGHAQSYLSRALPSRAEHKLSEEPFFWFCNIG